MVNVVGVVVEMAKGVRVKRVFIFNRREKGKAVREWERAVAEIDTVTNV